MGAALLDQRYSVSSLLCAGASARRFAGYHVGLDAPVRIVELRPPNQTQSAPAWDAGRCAAYVARAAALRHPALPRVRDCFYARGVCYVVEDALQDEWLARRVGRGRKANLRAALRDGLLLCDAVAHIARDAPELLPCLLISGATLAYDSAGVLHLTTWDYSRWLEGRSALDPGAPDLRAPEVRAAAAAVPDERAHVYSIAALLAFLLAGSVERLTAGSAGDMPEALRAALAPALHADPRQRTPDAETLGRAIAHAARLVLPALESMPITPMAARPPSRWAWIEQGASRHGRAQRARALPFLRPAARAANLARQTAPRALRQAGERSRAAVVAVFHHVGRPARR